MLLTRPALFRPFETAWLDKSLQEVLTQSALRFADAPAVADPFNSLSYAELMKASAVIAERVYRHSAFNGRRVALLFDQDAAYIVALLAILRAGGTYVPLDSRRDVEWNASAATMAGCELVLCAEQHQGLAGKIGLPVVCVRESSWRGNDSGICVSRDTDSDACIYFTSGTTAAAKGVRDSHRSLVHNAMRYTETLFIHSGDRMSLVQAPVFSGTQSTIFSGLINGATLCSFDVSMHGVKRLSAWLRQQKVTIFHGVPALFRAVFDTTEVYQHIRLIRLEGDRANAKDIKVLQNAFTDGCVLVNGLGATECGLIRQYFADSNSEFNGDLPLGYAVPDMTVQIVDRDGEEVAANIPGEIQVSSRYLASGYLGCAESASTGFSVGNNGERRYRTGDTGRMDTDGCLWLDGRKDDVVKIAGQSVSLGTIENMIAGINGVNEALVAQFFDSNSDAYLAAYIVPGDSATHSFASLREAVSAALPAHLRPLRIAQIDRLPLSFDGKIDRSALLPPSSDRPDLQTPYVAPRDAAERVLAAIWEEILSVVPIGISDDLMLLGCSSLHAARAMQRMEMEFDVELPIAELYQQPTIEALAEAINSADRA